MINPKYKTFTSDKAVVFDPPKRMACFDVETMTPVIANVIAYIPQMALPVVAESNSQFAIRWKYCAEIKE